MRGQALVPPLGRPVRQARRWPQCRPGAMPPGTSSASTACSLQATWVQARPSPGSAWTHTFSTAGWTGGHPKDDEPGHKEG